VEGDGRVHAYGVVPVGLGGSLAHQAPARPGAPVAVFGLLRDGGADATFLDLLMLLHTGGRERTLAEYAALLTAAGFAEPRHAPLATRRQLVVANA
jgi:hypothetical protein